MTADNVHAELRLVAAPDSPPPLPELPHLCDDSIRRPGEFHEPVSLDAQRRGLLDGAARRGRLPTGVTGRLLIEAALVRADLAAVSPQIDVDRLDDSAARAEVRRRLSAAEADYLRHLRYPRGVRQTLLTVPVRLIGRLGEVDLSAALGDDPGQAVSWEIGALLEGRTMLEWALVSVMRAG